MEIPHFVLPNQKGSTIPKSVNSRNPGLKGSEKCWRFPTCWNPGKCLSLRATPGLPGCYAVGSWHTGGLGGQDEWCEDGQDASETNVVLAANLVLAYSWDCICILLYNYNFYIHQSYVCTYSISWQKGQPNYIDLWDRIPKPPEVWYNLAWQQTVWPSVKQLICQIALCNPIMLVLVGFVLWASLLYVALEARLRGLAWRYQGTKELISSPAL